MKFSKPTMLVLAVATAAFLGLALFAFAADTDPVTVASILKAAGCPLTAAQTKSLADYTPPQRGQGMGGGQGAQGAAGQGAAGQGAARQGGQAAGQGAAGQGGQAAGQGGQRGGGQSALYDIFDAKQTAALIAKLGESPARGNQTTARPRNLSQLVALEKANLPLTEKQVADLKKLDMTSQEANTQMQAIFTAKQLEAVPMGRGGMGGGMGGGQGGGRAN